MTLSLLYKPGSSNLGLIPSAVNQIGGAGSVLLRPDTGQWWLPTLIHVATRNGRPCRVDLCSGSIAALQAGNKNFTTPSALSDSATIKDFTSLGANDTSTILSGTIISPGEGIQVNFYNGLGADVGYVEVWGTSSDVPPPEGTQPLVPGARFTGSTNSGETPVAAPGFVLHQWPGTGVFAPGTTDSSATLLDMRGYTSYNIRILAFKPNTSAALDAVRVNIAWLDDTNFIYHEIYTWWADDQGGGNPPNQNDGIFELQDSVHAQYVTVNVTNISGENLSWSGEVRGSVRPLGRAYVRSVNNFPISGPVNDTIYRFADGALAGGNTDTFAFPLRPGFAHLWISPSVVGLFVSFRDPESNVLIFQLTCAGGNNNIDVVMPSTAVKLEVFNNTGGAIAYTGAIISDKTSQGT